MTDFNKNRDNLFQSRSALEQSRINLFLEKERLKRINKENENLERVFNEENDLHKKKKEEIANRIKATEKGIKKLENKYQADLKVEFTLFNKFEKYTDPRTHTSQLSGDFPFLLFPLRIETRFKTIDIDDLQKHQLWIRVFPDDCVIDSFEPALSETEIINARTFWIETWKAGKHRELERGAWRNMVSSHGSGRAAWIVEKFIPQNLADKPQKTNASDIILVMASEKPLTAAEATAAGIFWKNFWLADGDRVKETEALSQLKAALGDAAVKNIVDNYIPENLDQVPDDPLTKSEVSVSTAFIHWPEADKIKSKKDSWTQPAQVKVMPDRFVLMGYKDGKKVLNMLGNLIPTPLVIGPDPSAASGSQFKQENGDLIVADDLKWMVDFERTVEVGMGFKVDLEGSAARSGYDRLIVLGLKLGADEKGGQALLEEMIQHHHNSDTGISLLPQGTATNNTDNKSSGFSNTEDSDESFDDIFLEETELKTTDNWLTRKDGQWLADMLGIESSILKKIHRSEGTDQCEAKAMNIALWPTTLGYFMDTMMEGVFDQDDIQHTRWFFNHFISGRGMIPTLRIGEQPYGILPVTVFSKMNWLTPRTIPGIAGLEEPTGLNFYLPKLYEVLNKVKSQWKEKISEVSYIGKIEEKDSHQQLLNVLGLHPGSVEFYQQLMNSSHHTYNQLNIYGNGSYYLTWLLTHFYKEMGMQLLRDLGYEGKETPDILDLFYLKTPNLLKGGLIDDRKLSEEKPIRDYAGAGVNYIHWLIKAAGQSLDTLRKQEGFTDNKPPTALLYFMLRHALQLGYWETSVQLYRHAELVHGDSLKVMQKEPVFIHVKSNVETSESRYHYLYQKQPAITGVNNMTVADFISENLGTTYTTENLHKQIRALEHLKDVPTARLERVFAEHLDCCSYRLDAWIMGLVHYRLAAMRYKEENESSTARKGLYLGAYGWLENVRPEHKKLSPVKLDAELDKIFNQENDPPLVKDSKNAGYIHAPSLNQAVTAAVLRNGYMANATPQNPDSLKVNLSSERVRMALSILQGIRNGQSMAALLGYRFERSLHDRKKMPTLNRFIFKFRKAFPLSQLKSKNAEGGEDTAQESISAGNVVNGLDLLEHIEKTGEKTFPFGIPEKLPDDATSAEIAAINDEVDNLMNLHDAVADLAMAESVHQVVQGNYDRAAATLDAYSNANFPPEPDVVVTPRSGYNITQRVGLHFEAGLDHTLSPVAGIPVTPRAHAEPAVNKWLSTLLPNPAIVFCMVSYFDSVSNSQKTIEVTQENLKLQPIDLLYILDTEVIQEMTDLDDRVVKYVYDNFPLRPDLGVTIDYIHHEIGKVSFFELSPLIANLRALILSSRPLKCSDVALMNEAESSAEKDVFVDVQRLKPLYTEIETLMTTITTFNLNLDALLQDLENKKEQVLSNIDNYTKNTLDWCRTLGLFGLSESGCGFIFEQKQTIFTMLLKKVYELVKRWEKQLDQFDQLLLAFDNLDPAIPDPEKFLVLQQAELLVSTTATIPLPATPAIFKNNLITRKGEMNTRLTSFNDLLKTQHKEIFPLFKDIKNLLPISGFDGQPFDLKEEEKQIIILGRNIESWSEEMAALLKKKETVIDDAIKKYEASSQPETGVEALLEAAKQMFGDSFRMVPEIKLKSIQGDEWEKAYNYSNSGDLLKYLNKDLEIDFPVDDWLYGLARVREKLWYWEQMLMLVRAFGKEEPELKPIQLPYKDNESWLAMEFPSGYEIDGDRLLYTAYYPCGFSKTKRQCGLLLDQWTETIPTKEETTGLTFHYDRPNSEAPQTMLLVTYPELKGNWNWEFLEKSLIETLEMAKLRAVEPQHLDDTSYAAFLPAVLSAVTMYPITMSMNLAQNNKIYAQVLKLMDVDNE